MVRELAKDIMMLTSNNTSWILEIMKKYGYLEGLKDWEMAKEARTNLLTKLSYQLARINLN